MKKPLMQRPMLLLALMAAPALALAARQASAEKVAVPVHQTPAAPAPTIIDEFRVVRSLPLRLTLESVHGPRIRITQHVGINESLALHRGEIIWLKISMARP